MKIENLWISLILLFVMPLRAEQGDMARIVSSSQEAPQGIIDYLCNWSGEEIPSKSALVLLNYFKQLTQGVYAVPKLNECSSNPYPSIIENVENPQNREAVESEIIGFFSRLKNPESTDAAYSRDINLIIMMSLTCDSPECVKEIATNSIKGLNESPIFCDFTDQAVDENVKKDMIVSHEREMYLVCDKIVGRSDFGSNINVVDDWIPENIREAAAEDNMPGIEWWFLSSDLSTVPREYTGGS